MADLKFGNVTPAVGNIKLGSNNVSEIYQGTTKLWPQSFPPSPGEVTVCDLVWTRENSIITATTTGGNIPIVTNQTDWVNAISNQQPAACYWDFDSNNAFRGLYYNVYTTEVIQPPAGFRLPTEQDFTDLRLCVSAGSPQGNMDVTSLGNNYYGFWTSTLPSNSRFGTVDFNAIGAGYTYKYGTGSQQFTGQGVRDIYWMQQPSSFPILNYFRGFMTYDNIDYVNNVRYLQGFNGNASNGFNHGFNIRFVKDAPPPATVNFYFNDTQTGTPTTSIYADGYRPGNTQGLTVLFKTSGISFEVIGGPATIKFVAYTDTGTAQPPLARFSAIDWRIYTNVNRLSNNLIHQTYWTNNSAGSDSFPIIPSTPSSTLGFSIENWGTEPGSVTLNPGVYYAWLAYTYGNSSISGGNVNSNYRASFEVGP